MLRSKGFLLASRLEKIGVWSQAGRVAQLDFDGFWLELSRERIAPILMPFAVRSTRDGIPMSAIAVRSWCLLASVWTKSQSTIRLPAIHRVQGTIGWSRLVDE